MIKKIKDNKIIIIIFIIMFLFGIHYMKDITANFDEDFEQSIVLSNIKSYAFFFKNHELEDALTKRYIVEINYSVERDHGVACYYPLFPLLLLSKEIPDIVSSIWRVYVYIIYFIGVIFFYKTTKEISKNNKIAILMTLLYFLSPRIFIDSLHNNKDITLMSLLIISFYYLIRIMKDNKNKDMIIFAFIIALLSNVKIIGVFFSGIMGIAYIIYLLLHKKLTQERIIDILFTFVLYIIIFILITPVIFTDGFHLIEYILYCLNSSVNFRWNGTVLFDGIYYNTAAGNRVPWYYLPKNIIITLPIIITILFIISITLFVIKIIKERKNKKIDFSNYLFIIIFTMFIIPLLICIIKKPNIYNSWRHFYFLYPLILLICNYVLIYIKKIKYKRIIIILIIISMIDSIYNIIRYDVRNAAYYNILVGTKDISKKYELDYYHVTTKKALEEFLASDKYQKNKDNKIYLYQSYNYLQDAGLLSLVEHSYELSKKVVIVTQENLKELKRQKKNIYFISNTVYEYKTYPKYKLEYVYKIKNNSILKFYKV